MRCASSATPTTQVDEIVAYIDEHKTILGAPRFKAEHLPVFACSMGDNTIHYMGHVKMMGAVQPFISGAISKCVVGDTLLSDRRRPRPDRLASTGARSPTAFRDEVIEVASLDGEQQDRRLLLRRAAAGPRGRAALGPPRDRHAEPPGAGRAPTTGSTGCASTRSRPDDPVAVQYGAELWSPLPARFDGFAPLGAVRQPEVCPRPRAR